MTTTVTALLVSHEGARWLPVVLDALAAQTRRPDRVVAVDTGSTDESPRLIRDRLGDVLDAPASSSYGAAVAAGLAAAPTASPTGSTREPCEPGQPADEWVWLLHDDSAPAPDALERLLAVAEHSPSVAILGPKLREWPSLRRLLEVGVTISGTGHRETGLERGEYDQGQHDRLADVLAVNTAGMLVRRPVLEALGFDERLPLFGTDIDFGWRAARAGHRVVTVPEAVVFHAEAASRGVRPNPAVSGRPGRGERAAALYVLLANGSAAVLPFRLVRLLVGGLLRALGLVLVRAPGEAVDELAALVSTYARPWRVAAARRRRRRLATVPPAAVRPLLAPPWVPYRHGLDFVGEVAAAALRQAGDAGTVRHDRPGGPEEARSGRAARLVRSPVAWLFAGLVLAAVVAARDLLGLGLLSGGALLPAPDDAGHWWRLYLSSWQRTGVGSDAPAAPYLLPLAVAGTVLAGKAWLVVDLVFLLAVPLAAAGAYRFLLRVSDSRPAALWGAAAYGLLPVATGSVQQGRLGTVVGTLVLPWLAHSALHLGSGHSGDRRRRAAWRTALWLFLLTAFVPVAWLVAAVIGVAAVAAGLAVGTRTSRRDLPRLAGAVLACLLGAAVLLLPWPVAGWRRGGLDGLLFEAGLPAPRLTEPLTRWDVVLGRPGDGAPGWLSAGVVVAALLALARPDTRAAVLRAWLVLVAALAVTAVLAAGTYDSVTAAASPQPLWLGFPLVVVQAAGITAACLAAGGLRQRLSGASFGWRQPVALVTVVLAVAFPAIGTVWWLGSGSDDPLVRGPATDLPTYMTDAAAEDPLNGILVVTGSRASGLSYALLRGAGVRLGDDSVQPSAADQAALTRRVQNLATAPEPADTAALPRLGIAYVYAPAPADGTLVGNLDSVSGITPASALRPGARAWQLDAAPSAAHLRHDPDGLRPWLLGLQGLALLAVVVLAVPTRERRR